MVTIRLGYSQRGAIMGKSSCKKCQWDNSNYRRNEEKTRDAMKKPAIKASVSSCKSFLKIKQKKIIKWLITCVVY